MATHSATIKCLPFPQLFPLIATKEEWLKVPSVKEKSATTFVEQVRDAWSSATNATRLLASGLLPRGIGEKQVKGWSEMILNNVVSHPDRLSDASLRMMLEGLDGWGAVRVESLMGTLPKLRKGWNWLARHSLRQTAKPKTIVKPSDLGPAYQALVVQMGDRPFVLFTGFRNAAWQSALEQKGNTILSSLSGKHTKDNTIVITKGTKDSSKVKKAMEKGIPVVRL